MIIVFLAFGVLFGACAAGLTLMSGGSVLLAILAYSAAGTFGALFSVGVLSLLGGSQGPRDHWADEAAGRRPMSV